MRDSGLEEHGIANPLPEPEIRMSPDESRIPNPQSRLSPMRADFYLIAKPRFREQPLRLVCELARKAHDANLWTLVLARDAAQAEALDDMLWDMGDDVFIPHQIAGAEIGRA